MAISAVAITEQEISNFFTLIDSINTVTEAGIIIEADEAQKKTLKERAIGVLKAIRDKILGICRWIKEHIIDKVINGAKKLLGKLPKVNLKKLKDEAIESAKKKDEGTAKQESVDMYRYLLTESDSAFNKINDFLKERVKLPYSAERVDEIFNLVQNIDIIKGDKIRTWAKIKSIDEWLNYINTGSEGISYERFIELSDKFEDALKLFDTSSFDKGLSELKNTANELDKKINEVKNFDPSKLTSIKDLLKFSAPGIKQDEDNLESLQFKISSLTNMLKIATEVYKNIVSAKTAATKFFLQIKTSHNGDTPVPNDMI